MNSDYLKSAINCDFNEMNRLVELDPKVVEDRDDCGNNAFLLGVILGNIDIMRTAVKNGCDPLLSRNFDFENGFLIAASLGFKDIMKACAEEFEMDVNAKNKCGKNAFTLASESGNDLCVEIAKEYGNFPVNEIKTIAHTFLSQKLIDFILDFYMLIKRIFN